MRFFKKNKIRGFLLLTFLVFYFFSFAIFASALELEYPTVFGMSIDGKSSLPQYAKYFFNIGIFIAVTLAGIVIAFGGIYYLVDFAKGKFASEGKEWLKAGIAGLLLSTCAYLIAYTINPYLVIFDLKGLGPLTYIANIFNPEPSSSLNVEIYKEIPIGTLTENLLAKTISCYNYDENGDPIDGEKIKTDDGKEIIGPTYVEHDRVDCILKLTQAAEKKAEKVTELSNKIVELMNSCNCGLNSTSASSNNSKVYCENKICSKKPASAESNETSDCTSEVECSSHSDYINYKESIGTTDNCKDTCSDTSCKCSGKTCDRCPEGYKDKIDHGPICLSYICDTNSLANSNTSSNPSSASSTKCSDTEKKFVGLDEFKSEYSNSYSSIKQVIEIQPAPKINTKEISVMKSSGCALCDTDTDCKVCDPSDKNYSSCVTEREKCRKEITKCEKERKQCLIKNSTWHKLRLIDQLTYLKGKIEEIKSGIEADLGDLKNAEADLGKCYLAIPYVDFLKIYESTDKNKTTISISKTLVNPLKYCKGYQYNNSSCYSQCQKICPGNQKDDYDCYSKATDCSKKEGTDKITCLAKQATEVKNCYDARSCTKNASPFSTFKECFLSCQQDCLDSCESACSVAEKTSCQKKCNNNSQCILKNEDKCLIDFNKLKTCTQNYNDLTSLQACHINAAKCPYCSDQFAGYADCLKSNYSLQGKYSTSYIYQISQLPNADDYLVCKNKNQYEKITSSKTNATNAYCIDVYPETTKCPASSACPECPCGDDGDYSITTTDSSSDSPINSSYIKNTAKDVTKNRICSGDCDDYFFNDDPLTFYCNTSWWKSEAAQKTTAIGEERVCPKSKEIPVGQTVDEAEAWGEIFLNAIEEVTKKIEDEIDYIKKIGEEKNYCNCDSKCDSAGKEATCQDKCIFNATDETTGSYEDSETGETITYSNPASCWCARQGCSGNPCQKIINMLTGKKSDEACEKGVEYKGVDYYRLEIASAEKLFSNFAEENSRTDIVKKLNYSRKTTNDCSVTRNNYDAEVEVLSCTRVEDEIISPIVDSNNTVIYNKEKTASYCYGKELGKVKGNDSLMDNWFCCELRKTSSK